MVACMAVVVMAPSAAPTTLSRQEGVHEERFAIAEWTGKRIDDNSWQWFAALVWESDPIEGEAFRFGGVIKGHCERKERRDGFSVRCMGMGASISKRDSFTVDPLARSAVLDIRDRWGKHHVEWTATDDVPGIFESETVCPAGSGHGAGISRQAVAGGHVYGSDRYSRPSFRTWNAVWTGVKVTQCRFLSDAEIVDLKDGGSFTIRLDRKSS